MVGTSKTYASFHSFWPFYLSQHSNLYCRRAHFLGSTLALLLGLIGVVSGSLLSLFSAIGVGYAFAWFGHFYFEKNRPATFQYPFYSLMGDWKMLWMMLTGKLDEEIQRIRNDL